MKTLAWVLAALLLAGCNFEIPGQKAKDAAAMGYACRISKKSPEQCMRESPAFSQNAILDGWREADNDVKEKKVDTDFSAPPPFKSAVAEGEPPPEGENPPETQPAEPAKGH